MKINSSLIVRVLISLTAGATGLILLAGAALAATRTMPVDQDPTGILGAMRASVIGKLVDVQQANTAQSDLTQIPRFADLVQQDTSQFTLKFKNSTFSTDLTTVLPKSDIAVSRALRVVGNADAVCGGGTKCEHLCDHVAGWIWGYEDNSGYYSAYTHWQTAVATGVAHPGSRNVPVGANLFWKGNSEFGHIATYVGNGQVVTNMIGPKGSQLYLVPADLWEKTWGVPYLGWAMPIYHGESVGTRL